MHSKVYIVPSVQRPLRVQHFYQPNTDTLTVLVGDTPILLAAQSQIRNGFVEKRSLDPLQSEATLAIEHAHAVAKVLRQNVVQGHKKDGEEHSYSRLHGHCWSISHHGSVICSPAVH